jgi:hypothetical protein
MLIGKVLIQTILLALGDVVFLLEMTACLHAFSRDCVLAQGVNHNMFTLV